MKTTNQIMEVQMKIHSVLAWLPLITLFLACSAGSFAGEEPVFNIPRIEGMIVDGSISDWNDKGFRIDFLTGPNGRSLPAHDFDVQFRVGWSRDGLLVLAVVRDDIPVEQEEISRLWRSDCVEIVLSEKKGSTNRHSIVLSSGADPGYKKLRRRIYDWRPEDQKLSKLTVTSKSRVSEGGYAAETLFPWNNLGIDPEPGMELGLQLTANDDDRDSDGLRVSWFPVPGPANPDNLHRIRLSDKPASPVNFRADREISLGRWSVSLRGSANLVGESVKIKSGREIIKQGKLELLEGRAGFRFSQVKGEGAEVWPRIEVILGDKHFVEFESQPTLDSIMDKFIQAMGGRSAIEKLKTRTGVGQWVYSYNSKLPDNKGVPLEVKGKIPDRWMASYTLSKGPHKNAYDGKTGWRLDADRIEHVREFDKARLGWILNPQGAMILPDYFPSLVLKKREVRDGRTVYVVGSKGRDKISGTLTFDAESGLIVGLGENWILEDYREVDGIMFPFRVVVNRGEENSAFVFDSVKHNESVDDSLFAIPDHREIFPDAFQDLHDPKILPMLMCIDLTYNHEEMNVPCRDGRFLYDYIIKKNYQRGLEIGTFTGYSTLWFGLAFKKTGGKVITLEIDPKYGREAALNFKKAGLEEWIDSRICDALEEITRIKGDFDFVFIDAWKPDYVKYLSLLRDRVLPGGVIIAHNVTNYARDMKEYLDAIKSDPGLETTFSEISAEGMSISVVRHKNNK
jgi:predicted O-methyltransferase YrrM